MGATPAGEKLTDILPVSVKLDAIETTPGPYCMSFGFDLVPLVQSLDAVGLLNPPVLMDNGAAPFTVVVGYRRILAQEMRGKHRLACKILSHSQISDAEALLLNLYDNLSARDLNPVEKAMALSRLEAHFNHSQIVRQFMPLLGLPRHLETLHFYLRLERNLGPEVKGEIARGGLSMKATRLLLEFDPSSRADAFKWLMGSGLNANQQKQALEYLIDLSRIKGVSITRILEQDPIRSLWLDSRRNRPQKAKAIFRALCELRFPRFTEAQRAFKKHVARLKLPPGVRVQVPPYFESPGYALEVSFQDGKDLKHTLETLARVEGLEKLKDPWEA